MQISVSDTGSMTSQLSVSTYYGLVKLLSTCVAGSHTVAENLLQSGISGTLHNLLRRCVSRVYMLLLLCVCNVCLEIVGIWSRFNAADHSTAYSQELLSG